MSSEFRRSPFLVRGVGDDRGQDGADKTEADDHDDFLAGLALVGGTPASLGFTRYHDHRGGCPARIQWNGVFGKITGIRSHNDARIHDPRI